MKVIVEIEYNATEWTIMWLLKILNNVGVKFKLFKIEKKDSSKELEAKNEIYYSVSFIKKVICIITDTPIEIFESKSRKQEIAENRQIAMYFCRKYTRKSLREIGKEFGDKNPATITHACKVIQNLLYTDKKFKFKLEKIEKIIVSGRE